MDEFIACDENFFILIDNVKHEIYQGTNKNPFYYLDNKEIYLTPNNREKLNNLILTTVKAV